MEQDWNDAPFECNAGEPYLPLVYHTTNGARLSKEGFDKHKIPKFRIYTITIPCDIMEKHYHRINNNGLISISVEDINNGITCWLVPTDFDKNTVICAGCEIEDFILIFKELEIDTIVEEYAFEFDPKTTPFK